MGLVGATVVAGVFAGIVAVGVTVIIERWGGTLGGLLGTMPTTIVPASLGIWVASAPGDVAVFADAMNATPSGMLLNAVFLWIWRVAPPRLPQEGLGRLLASTIALSMAVWLLLALGFVTGVAHLREQGASLEYLGFVGFAVLVAFGLWGARVRLPAPKGTRRVPPRVLIARGVGAGLAVASAVLISKVAGGIAGGVASVFPAIFVTTMVSLWVSQGRAVPTGAVGPMMLGSSSVGAYALFAHWFFLTQRPATAIELSLAVGGSWLLAVATTTVPAYWLLSRRR